MILLKKFELWKDLPLDILIDRILYEYCDGKTLSILALTIIVFGGINNNNTNNNNNDDDDDEKDWNECQSDDDNERYCNNNNKNYDTSSSCSNRGKILQSTEGTGTCTHVTSITTRQQQLCNNSSRNNNNNKKFNTMMVLKAKPEIGKLRIRNLVFRFEKDTVPYDIDAIEWIRSLPKLFFKYNDNDDSTITITNTRNLNRSKTTKQNDKDSNIPTNLQKSVLSLSSSSSIPQTLRNLTDFLLIVDYLINSIRQYTTCQGCYEWPIWCGTIIIDTIEETIRVRRSARVVITIPMIEKLHPISAVAPSGGCGMVLYNTNPTQIFTCEPYNTIPIPPWGKIYGITEQDERILQNQIGSYLATTNQVAKPSTLSNYSSSYDVLNIRIMTQQQAQYRRRTGNSSGNVTNTISNNDNINNNDTTVRHRQWVPPPVPTEWMITNNNNNNINNETIAHDDFSHGDTRSNKLICTWEMEDSSSITDNMFTTERDSISYLLQLQQIYNDLLKQQ